MPTLHDIATVLDQRRRSYRWLDVFASDIEELKPTSGHPFHHSLDGGYLTQVGDYTLRMSLLTDTNVARFELVANPSSAGITGAAITGAVLGGAIAGQGRRSDVPAGMIFGMLVGGLLGAMATAPAKQIMTLRFDPVDSRWDIYHGPYIGWAKEALSGVG